MAEAYGYNITDLTDLERAQYAALAELGFATVSKMQAAVSSNPRHSVLMTRGNSMSFTASAGIDTAVTTAYVEGAAVTATTPTDSQVNVKWNTYPKSVQIDQSSEQASAIELVNSSLQLLVRSAARTYDYVCGAVLQDATNYDTVGQSVRTSLTASNVLTKSAVAQALAFLQGNEAPGFIVPGIGEVYLAFAHPHVLADLKGEASGLFVGGENVNSIPYQHGTFQVSGGFLWIPTATAALLEADGGVSPVDAYDVLFVADESVAMTKAPVAFQPGCLDVAIAPDRSMIGRVSFPGTNAGIIKEVSMIANIGFGIINQNGVYRWECASAFGANS